MLQVPFVALKMSTVLAGVPLPPSKQRISNQRQHNIHNSSQPYILSIPTRQPLPITDINTYYAPPPPANIASP